MNNVFRLIWNRTLGRLVVASEAARSQHKAGNGSKQVGQSPIPVRKTTECQLFTPLKPKALLLACASMLLLPLGISDAEARKFASDGGSCVSGGGGVAIGRLITTNTNADPVDGSGTYSTVAGCNASGNNQSAATVYGTFSQVTGAGGAAFGFNVRAARWATAIGLESRATGVSGTALGFGSQATARNAVAIGGAGGDGTTPLAVADSTIASGINSIAIGSNNVRGAQALGSNAIAIGGEATASQLSSTALGNKSQATGATSLAIGERSEAKAEFANALGVQSKAEGLASLAVGPAAKALAESSVAMGRRSEATELQSIAVGLDSKASGVDSLAIGTGAIASGDKTISIGFANEVSGTSSGAIGDPNIITGAGSYALGNDNTIDADEAGAFGNRNILAATADGSRIIGNDNNIDVSDAMVVGNNADVTQAGGVALGSGSVADTAAGIAGYVPFGATAADTAAINGTVATQSAVDIGSRQITSVAAGTELDDAVNVSQLVATQSSVAAGTNVTNVAESDNPNGGTIYTVNAEGASVSAGSAAVDVTAAAPDASNVTDYAVDLSQASKDSLLLADSALQTVVTQIDGTAVKTIDQNDNVANFVTGKNMVLSPDGAGGIEIATLDNVTFTDVQTSTLTAGPVNIGAAGIDAGNTTISGVAPGVAGTDAVNLNQLDDAAAASKTEVAGGTNIASVDKATGINGQDIYTVNADSASVSAGSGAVDVTAAAPDANNVTDYAVDLSQASKDSLTLADSALQDVVTQVDGVDVKTLTKGDNNANFVTGKNMVLSPDGAGGIEIATLDNVTFTDVQTDTLTAGPVNIGATGIDAGNTTISGVAPGVAGTDAVNLNQLDDAAAASKTEVAGGTNIASVDKATGINGQDIYTVNADGASVSAGSGAVDVTAAAPDANNVTDYAVDLSQASKDSLTLADSALQTVVTQINGVEVKTLDQNDNVANFIEGKNVELTDIGGSIEVATADDVTFTSINSDSLAITGGPTLTGSGIDMNATTISNLADGVNANDAVNLSQLENSAAASKTEVVAGTNVTSVDQATGADGQAIYTVNADSASVSTGSGAVDVTAAAPDANNVTDYAVDLSQASKDSLTLADSALQTVVTQIDGNAVKTIDQNDNVANFVTGDNIVLSDESGGIKIATADDVTFTSINSDSLAITGGPTLTGGGIDMNGGTISDLAPGVNPQDAVNLSQLENSAAASKTEVVAGTNVTSVDQATGADGQAIYTVNADSASVSAGSGAVDVTAAAPDANNVTDYAVDLSQASKDSLTLADSALQTVVTQIDGTAVKTIDQNDNVANFVTGDNIVLSDDAGGIKIATADDVTFTSINSDSLAITGGPTLTGSGIDMNATTISNLADGVNANDAVNLSQLENSAAASKTEVAGGTNVANVDKATGINGQDIYTVNADGASVSASSGAVDVTAAAPDANNVTDYAVDLSQASKDSLTLADSALQTVVTQINGVEVKTLDQNDNVANFIEGKNVELTDIGGSIEVATADDVTFTSINSDSLAITGGPTLTGSGIDMNATTISNLADGVNANDAVNLSQLENSAAASKTEVAGGTNVANVDKATGINGQDIYTVNADGASVSAGSGAVDVTAAAPDASNVTDYAVDLSQASKDSLALADSALQTVVTQIDGTAVKTIDQNDNVANFVTGDNIVLSDEAGGIKIDTADDVTFTSINSDSLAITGGPTLTGGGIDMNGGTISDLAPGVNPQDAVNLSQLENSAAASKTEVAGGTNIASVDKATGINGQDIYTVNADGSSVSAGTGVDVVAAAPDANNVTDYEVALNQDTQDSLLLADSALQTVVTQIDGTAVKTIDQNDNVANFVTGDNIVLSDEAGGIKIATADDVTFTSINSDSLAITGGPTLTGGGIDMSNTTISNLADGVNANDAVNLSQLEGAAAASKTEVVAGTNVTSVDQATGADGQAIYTVNADSASVSAGSGAVDVTAAAPDANNVTDYAVDLSQASKDSLTLADSALQTVVTQIDGTAVKTIDQNDNVANFVTGDNIVLSDDVGGIKIATADDVTFTSINSDSLAITGGPTLTGGGIDMSNTTISNLADGVNANDAVNLSQLEGAAAASKTEVVAGTNVTSVDQATGADGQDIYTVNADSTSVSAGSGAVDVTAAAPDASNVTDYAVDLSQASKDSLLLADSALQTVVTQINGVEVKTLDQNDNVANFIEGKNVELTDIGGSIEVATADDVTFTSINSDSLAITGGPTLTGGGIDMSNTTISNLADGVNANDAVNLSQLEKVSSSANAGWNVTTSNETGTASSNVGPNANVDFVSGDDNVVISHVRSEDGSTSVDYRLADDVRIGNSVSVGDTSISNDGLVIAGGPSVTTQGIDAGNKQITNAASGVGDTPLDELEGDAMGNVINAGDLQNVANSLGSSVAAAKTEVEAGNNMMVADRIGDDGQIIYTVATADEVSFDQVDIGSVSINADTVDDSGNTIISGVGEGGISEDSTDAINGSQLWATQDLIKNLEGGVINIAGDLSDEYITNNGRGIRYVRTNDEGLDVSDAFAEAQGSTALGYEARATGDRALAMGYEAMASHQGSVALGEGARTEAAIGTASVEIGGQTYQFAGVNPVATVSVGNAGSERTITNVAAGRISVTSTDAINGSQLYASNQFMDTLDDRLTIVEGGLGDLTETVAGIPQGGGEGAVEYARNDDGSINKNTVELAGDGGSKITNVAPGEIASGSSDAVSGDQLHTTRQDVAGNTANIEGNRNQIAGNTDSISNINTTLDKGLNVSADQGEPVNRQLGDTVAVTGDNNITTRTTGQGVQVTLNRELNVNSVTTGNTTINNDGVRIQDGPSMTQTGFDANGTTITNVAPGVNAGDAVNVGQMNELGQRFANEINNVHGRIDKVERNANAGIAAVAAMGHAPYVPGKLTYHVGGGHHGGESAVGINFRRTADNGRWSLNAGIAGSRAGATIGVGISGVID